MVLLTCPKAPFPDYSNALEATPTTSLPFTTPDTPSDLVFIDRRTSPRGYSQHVQDLIFPSMTTQGLGIETHGVPLLPSSVSSPTSESIPALDFGRRRSTPIPIAPNPSGTRQVRDLKRSRDESDLSESSFKRRKRSTSFQKTVDLSEEEKLLLELKEEQNLPWKEIAQKFEATFKKPYQQPALQMRIKRLLDRMRQWTEEDVSSERLVFQEWNPHSRLR